MPCPWPVRVGGGSQLSGTKSCPLGTRPRRRVPCQRCRAGSAYAYTAGAGTKGSHRIGRSSGEVDAASDWPVVLVREAIRGLALGGVQQLRPEDLIRDALVIIGVSSPADGRAGAGIGEARLWYIGSQPTIRVSLWPGRPAAAMGAARAR